MKIEISRCSPPYLKKITDTHPIYHLDGEFCSGRRVSSKYAIYEVTEAGIYQGPKAGKGNMVAGNRRIDTGLIRLDADGTATEITLEEAKTILEIDKGNKES